MDNSVGTAFLQEDSTIRLAIANLNESHIKIVLVVSEDRVLRGTISDGDIRRGFLKGLDINSSIKSIINRNPVVAPSGLCRETALLLMTANNIQQIPIIDDERRVVGIHLWDSITEIPARLNPMVIMAGGLGSRLRPYTENCPKPMLLISGKPILEHIIDRAKLEGFSRFILAIHYLGNIIEDYFGNGERMGVKINYLKEKSPLGTAGALGLLNPRPNMPFVVTNGDVLTDIHYSELLDFHNKHSAFATMAVRAHEWQHPYGVVQIDGIDIIGFEEKPIHRSHVNAGVYILEPDTLNYLEVDSHCDMPTLFERLQANAKRTAAYPIHEPWFDIGVPDDLHSANNNGKSCG
ncbi:nucleotidyl transferase [Chlorobium phaeovibrioides]|uniref:nucleotidyltransferase family protein n=1 Tax=Chlorobium phaeovibrioides TaxID=1094 RepID=UPI000F84C479|nr:nucleotidyltransferase family protein [Chlorobium phaeovibrioides]RTY34154.1 nucleotidyl transferase [Chlorobium phaeovibrioides]